MDKKIFADSVNNQHKNENIIVSICELGFCVIARRNINKGEYIFTFKGKVIDFSETKRKGEQECMPIQFGENQYVDTEAPGKYINHSCEPNAGIVNNFDLIALEDIAIHTEIRFDYSTTMDENSYKMQCKCRKKTCRSIVTDFKDLPTETKKKYIELRIISDFIYKKHIK